MPYNPYIIPLMIVVSILFSISLMMLPVRAAVNHCCMLCVSFAMEAPKRWCVIVRCAHPCEILRLNCEHNVSGYVQAVVLEEDRLPQ